MRYYEEVLAQSARNYAFTHNKKWEQRYRMLEPESDKLLKKAIKDSTKKDKEFFLAMDKANLDLVEMETKALDLVNAGQAEEAVKLLEGDEYERRRKILRDGLTEQVKTMESFHSELAPPIQPTSIVDDSTKTIIDLESKLYEKLREADAIKQEFLAMITHELKTPLVPIKGYVDILLSETWGKLNETQKEKLEIIRGSTEFLLKLISDLLDAQKIELGQLALVKKVHSLSDIIKDVLVTLQHDLQSHDITVSTELENISCLCDQTRIEQVLNNLIRNAMDFCPKKNGKISIKLQRDGNTHVKISVIDNGVGIPKNKLEQIFIKFYQIDTSTTREHGGTGLGLVVCKGIIENHGGKIWAESEGSSKGAQFHILLPAFN